ncbi:unnamed protein product [Microthlaspi erraticum]|uniref:Uncharacterized protein n=1 Tax=Microthlaspi erraticum TaxID=1685480 RepID=A0A6D2K867_9BRAS|nr:unnamed protein product [Microthlaspi erraticum]
MVGISELCDDLLLKILSFLPTKVAVSTSILSKQWQFLWMWLPKLEYGEYDITGPLSSWSGTLRYEEFMDKNLTSHRAPVIESLLLRFCHRRLPQPEKIKLWIGIALSRCVRELSIVSIYFNDVLSLPSGLYTCNSLMTLKLEGEIILVDVPRIVYLPSLKNLQLRRVTYSNEDSLGLLISSCPVLEILFIYRYDVDDNVRAIVVNVPSLQRLVLEIGGSCSDDGCVIDTPSLKYLKIVDYRHYASCLIEPMPKLEEADIAVVTNIEKVLKSVKSARRLSLRPMFCSKEETVDRAGIVFSQLEHLKLCICRENWSKLLLWLLRNSPKLRVLNLFVDTWPRFDAYEPVDLKNKESPVPECLLSSLETFEFAGFRERQEETDFLSFFFKHAFCLKSTSVIRASRRF